MKAVVTCEGMIDIEFKNKQAYQGIMYARMIGLGNGNLKSLHDKSVGFYRRQLVIRTKERPLGRVNDPFLSEKLISEIPGIVLWCLEGLHRLIHNNYKFSISERAELLKKDLMEEDNNIQAFLASTGYIRFDKTRKSTTRALYNTYKQWCYDNAERYVVEKTFSSYLKQNAEQFGITYDKNIPVDYSKYQRGYRGIETLNNKFAEILTEERYKVPFNAK